MKEVLVIGGGIAGIQAALDLAEQGLRVHLVERTPSIGGRMAQLDKTFPTNDCSTCILSPKMVDCARHPNILLHTYSEVLAVTGEAGDFRARVLKHPRYVDETLCTGCGDCALKCPRKVPDEFNLGLNQRRAIYLHFPQAVPMVMTIDPEHCTYLTRGKCGLCQKVCQAGAIDFEQQESEFELEVGAIVVATGYDFYDASHLSQYGYGRYPNVITALEYERLISASGPTGGHLLRPSDGQPARKIGFVQCAGSRHVRHNRYCSTVCCVHSTKEAVLAWEHDPAVNSHVFYTDLRGSGKGFREYIDRAARDYAVNFVHGRVAQILEDADHNPIIKYEHENTLRPERMTVDLAVLAISLVPARDAPQVAAILDVGLDDFGFVQTDPLAPVDTSRPGIVACGCCLGPADIPQSVAQASAAAARAAEFALA
ncbi:MAG: CoB--CoM heterodisulfide reductase iron-sulfur subunit A family protein [Anaerolineae bacterium]|nr:CoB--CoM heterodisulfide reductase iron-sulfur subunit A family protein [Anaerolineae bacterium]